MSATTLTSSPSPSASPSAFHRQSPRSSFASAQRTNAAPRASPRLYASSSSPRRALNAPSGSSSGPQQPKQYFVDDGPVAGISSSYVDAGTQYSPDGFPPTAGHNLAAHAGRPPGTTVITSGARKRKESSATESSSEPMSGSSASSGAPQIVQRQPEEPQIGQDPGQASSSNVSAEPELQEARSTHGHSAAPKRSRPEGTLKIMPHKYETCNPKDLGVLVANMLMELIRINDRIPLRDGRLTRFHSRAPPGISVSDYLQRLIQHATLSPPILLSMVYYIDRLCTLYPAFTINSLTVHRFLITAATVAAKGLSDSFWTNPTYARIGGIPVSELATLELELLQRVHWKIVPKPEVLEEYYASLVDRTDGFTLETSSSRSSTSVGSSSMDERGNDKRPEDGDEQMQDGD